MFEDIRALCQKYTDLENQDIDQLIDLSKWLDLSAQAHQGDIFIDCKTYDANTAIVVAEHTLEGSSYRERVVGKFALRKNEPAALRTLDTGDRTILLDGISQENQPMLQTTTPIYNKDKLIGVLIIENRVSQDFGKANQMENQVMYENDSKNGLVPIINEFSKDGLLIFNKNGILTYANGAGEKIYRELGYLTPIQGMHFHNLSFGDVLFNQIIQNGYLETEDLAIGDKYYNIKYSRITRDKRVVMVIRDTTLLKQQEKALISKSVMVQEVHHRVKNNLQTIASLLRLQSRRSSYEKVQEALQESINRILSIAATHEILARDIGDSVDMKDLVNQLLQSTLYKGADENRVSNVQVLGDPLQVPSLQATTLSIIINELVSNAYEHAFTKDQRGQIQIHFKEEEGLASIYVEDNGCGFNPHIDKKNSFGLNIVRGLTEESLNGQVQVESSSKGTLIKLHFALSR